MKASKQLAVPLLCVIVGLAMIVTAAGIVSNVVEHQNRVISPTSAVWVRMMQATDTPGGDKLDYVDGTVYVATEYDFKVNVLANQSVTGLAIVMQFSAPSIDVGNVTVRWTTVLGSWTTVTFTTSGNTITGNIGAIGDYGAGNDANYYVILRYNLVGDYTMKLWAEGTV